MKNKKFLWSEIKVPVKKQMKINDYATAHSLLQK